MNGTFKENVRSVNEVEIQKCILHRRNQDHVFVPGEF